MKLYTGYGVQKITIGISYGIARILLELKVYTGYGVRKITVHRDKLRDCENFFGTESIHGVRSTENNHRDKLRDCE